VDRLQRVRRMQMAHYLDALRRAVAPPPESVAPPFTGTPGPPTGAATPRCLPSPQNLCAASCLSACMRRLTKISLSGALCGCTCMVARQLAAVTQATRRRRQRRWRRGSWRRSPACRRRRRGQGTAATGRRPARCQLQTAPRQACVVCCVKPLPPPQTSHHEGAASHATCVICVLGSTCLQQLRSSEQAVPEACACCNMFTTLHTLDVSLNTLEKKKKFAHNTFYIFDISLNTHIFNSIHNHTK
jgi:hypothetical protein